MLQKSLSERYSRFGLAELKRPSRSRPLRSKTSRSLGSRKPLRELRKPDWSRDTRPVPVPAAHSIGKIERSAGQRLEISGSELLFAADVQSQLKGRGAAGSLRTIPLHYSHTSGSRYWRTRAVPRVDALLLQTPDRPTCDHDR